MSSLGEAVLYLRGDGSGLDRTMAQTEKTVGSRMKSIGAGMAKAGAGLTAGVTLPLIMAGKAFGEEMAAIEQANAETTKSLERMGEGSLVSVAGVQALAAELQQLSGADDQLIQSGQNAILALGGLDTATKQGAATFEDASRAMVDMAEAIPGMEVDAAGKMIAKALADPASAAGKLTKAGVTLSDSQQAMIEKFMKAGDTAAAQGVIVDALGEKFKGAANITNTEKLDVMKDRFAGIGAELLTHLIPSLEKLGEFLDDAMGAFEKLSPKSKKIVAVMLALAAALGPVLMVGGSLMMVLPAIGAALGAISLPVVAVVAGLAALGYALFKLWKTNEGFRNAVKSAWAQIKAGVTQVLASLRATISVWVGWAKSFWAKYGESISAATRSVFEWLSSFIGNALDIIKNVIQAVLAVLRGDWGEAWDHIKQAAAAVWKQIKHLISGAMKGIWALLRGAFALLKAGFSKAWDAIKSGASRAWDGIKNAVVGKAKALVNAARSAIGSAIGKIREVWHSIREGVGNAWDLIKAAAERAAVRLVVAAILKFREIKAKISEIWSDVRGRVSGAWDLIKDAAVKGAQKVIDGARNKLEGLVDMAKDLGGRMADGIKNAINGILEKWNNLGLKMPSVKVAGKTVYNGGVISTPNIPLLARGGIVTDPTLAMIGEGRESEAVLPLSKLDALLANTGGGGDGLTQNFYPERPVEDMPAFMRRARLEARWAGMR